MHRARPSKNNCSPMGNSAFSILGRLVNTGLVKRPLCATHKASPGSVRPDGPPGQPQEGGASTHSGICLPRVRFSSRNVPLFSTSKENAENLGSHSRYHQTPRSASTLGKYYWVSSHHQRRWFLLVAFT